MTINTMVVRLTDGLKSPIDYAPNRVYDISATIDNPTPDTLEHTITMIRDAGNRYLSNTRVVSVSQEIGLPGSPEHAEALKTRKPRKPATPAADPMAEHVILNDPHVIEHIAENKADLIVQPNDTDMTRPREPIQPEPAIIEQDDLADVLGAAPAITDEQLGQIVRRRNAELGETGPQLIRGLLNSYNPEPETRVFQLKELTQSDRSGFLDKLNQLQGA